MTCYNRVYNYALGSVPNYPVSGSYYFDITNASNVSSTFQVDAGGPPVVSVGLNTISDWSLSSMRTAATYTEAATGFSPIAYQLPPRTKWIVQTKGFTVVDGTPTATDKARFVVRVTSGLDVQTIHGPVCVVNSSGFIDIPPCTLPVDVGSSEALLRLIVEVNTNTASSVHIYPGEYVTGSSLDLADYSLEWVRRL